MTFGLDPLTRITVVGMEELKEWASSVSLPSPLDFATNENHVVEVANEMFSQDAK